MSEESYTVTVKPSARRSNAAVGRLVNRMGPHRRFASKPLAREWARELSSPRATVWIQDAVPNDDSDVDGYLVGGDRAGAPAASRPGPTQSTLPTGK